MTDKRRKRYLNEASSNSSKVEKNREDILVEKYIKRTDEGILPGKKSVGFISAIAGFAAAGYIGWPTVPLIMIGLLLLYLPVEMAMMATGKTFYNAIKGELESIYQKWQQKKEIDPDQIKKIADNIDNTIEKMPEGGKKKYLKSLQNKYKKQIKKDPDDKDVILSLQKDLKSKAKKYKEEFDI